jgi:hypothetical protein
MGVMFLLQVTSNSPYFTSTNINYTVPYLSLSLALNIIITIVIVLRLLTYRHRISKVLGSTHGAQYTSIAAMIVESAALYSAFSVAFLTLFLLNNPISAIFLQSFTQVQVSTGKQRRHSRCLRHATDNCNVAHSFPSRARKGLVSGHHV